MMFSSYKVMGGLPFVFISGEKQNSRFGDAKILFLLENVLHGSNQSDQFCGNQSSQVKRKLVNE